MLKSSTFWKSFLPVILLIGFLGVVFAEKAGESGPLKILLIAGGCCHDYATQTKLLKAGLEERLEAEVTVEYNPDTSTKARFAIYDSPDWADRYDLVIHDECTANVTDRDYVKRILQPHRDGVPAVNLHCAMHSYRWDDFRSPVEAGADNAGWFEMIGVQSSGHGPKSPVHIRYESVDHPVIKGLKNWRTVDEELYNNIQVFDGTTVLARGYQIQFPRTKKNKGKAKQQAAPQPPAKPALAEAAVIWANEYGPNKTRIFSTTIGHFNETVADPRYLDLLTNGIVWASGDTAKRKAR